MLVMAEVACNGVGEIDRARVPWVMTEVMPALDEVNE